MKYHDHKLAISVKDGFFKLRAFWATGFSLSDHFSNYGDIFIDLIQIKFVIVVIKALILIKAHILSG